MARQRDATAYLLMGVGTLLWGLLAGGIAAAIGGEWAWFYAVAGAFGVVAQWFIAIWIIAKGVEVGNRSSRHVGG